MEKAGLMRYSYNLIYLYIYIYINGDIMGDNQLKIRGWVETCWYYPIVGEQTSIHELV